MVYIKSFEITTDRDGFHNITDSVSETVKESGVKNGIVTVECSHSTAGILEICSYGREINEDILREMRRLVPARINFSHQDPPEDAAGHLKSCFFGSSVSCIVCDRKRISEGKKDIYFAEYDGPRNRSYTVCVVGEER